MRKILLIVTQLLFALSLSAQTQQELRDSVSMISKLIEEHPRAVKLRLRKAALNIALDQWQYALDEYTNVLEMMPSNLTALYYRGYVNQHMKRYNFARQDYEALLKYEPSNEHALMGLILTNLADSHTTEAYDGANRLVTMFPESPSSYSVRADVEQGLGMVDAAIDDLEKAIALESPCVGSTLTIDDDMASYQLSVCELYLSKGEKSKARKSLDYLVQRGIAKASLYDYYVRAK